jgi:hypothetical protein
VEKKGLNLLTSQINYQLSEIEKIIKNINERKKNYKKDIIVSESLAYQLHNFYCAFEQLFEIVANFFENNIEDPSRYHIQLLTRMTLNIEGVRPALISKDVALFLDDLRSFRHIFRHGYSYKLDINKLTLILEKYEFVKKNYKKEINKFLKAISS